MPTRNRWIAFSLTGLCLAAAAGLAYAAASEAEAAGLSATDADTAEASEATEVRHSQIRLVLDHDGTAEQLELADLHEMEVGESRTLTTASGTPVVVTRDEQGFEIDLDGKKIRVMDHFSGEAGNLTWTSEDGSQQIHKRIIVREGGEGEAGGANVMILRNKGAVDANGAVITSGSDSAEIADGGHDVVMLRRMPGDGAHAFAFATGDGELPAIPMPVEATIARLEASAKFQELDEATRTKVLEALRESAPKSGAFVAGAPGSRTIVLEMEDEDETAGAN